MKLLSALIFFLGVSVATAADQQPTITVHGPTIVAFSWPFTEAELKAHPDTNEAFADFEFYTGRAMKALQNSGIYFQTVDATSFKTRTGSKTTTFRVGKSRVGYYFVAPGKKPRVEYGVNNDLVETAERYFGKVGK
jgi:hypothetical protein